jgi:single-strand DNA-binding protein
MASCLCLEESLEVRQDSPKGQLITLEGTLRYREVEDEVKGTTFKHRIAEIHTISMKRLSKIEAADDPSDRADDE